MSKAILAAENFSAGYAKPLFESANLVLNAGEVVSLVGPNGTGKSTLLKSFAGLLPPLSGKVNLCGIPLVGISMRQRSQWIASVFTQEHVPYGMTVREFVSLGRIPYSGIFDGRNDSDEAAIDSAIQNVQLENFVKRRVQTLSAGERSRVFIARAIASSPKILLLDEPTAFLDVPNILRLFRFLQKLAEEKQMAILLSTHHVDYAIRFSQKLIALDGKRKIFEGDAAAVKSAGFLSWAEE